MRLAFWLFLSPRVVIGRGGQERASGARHTPGACCPVASVRRARPGRRKTSASRTAWCLRGIPAGRDVLSVGRSEPTRRRSSSVSHGTRQTRSWDSQAVIRHGGRMPARVKRSISGLAGWDRSFARVVWFLLGALFPSVQRRNGNGGAVSVLAEPDKRSTRRFRRVRTFKLARAGVKPCMKPLRIL